MKKKYSSLVIIVVLSWILEFLWIRYGLSLDLRIAGIHLVPLFILPLISVFLALPTGTNLIGICGRIGRFRWWLAAVLLPVLSVCIAGGIMMLCGVASIPEETNTTTRILAIVVDLPLNYLLWFPALFSTEICWRGVFQYHEVQPPRPGLDALTTSVYWMLSLSGVALAGFWEKGYSIVPGITALFSLLCIGWFQSAVRRRSGSILVSGVSLLSIVLMFSLLQTIPLTNIEPLVVWNLKKPPYIPAGIPIASVLLVLCGFVLERWRTKLPMVYDKP